MHGTADALRWNRGGFGGGGGAREWESTARTRDGGAAGSRASSGVDARRAQPGRSPRSSGTPGEHALFALALAALGGLHVAAVALFL